MRQRLVVAAGGLLREEVAKGAAGEARQRPKALRQAQPHLSTCMSDPAQAIAVPVTPSVPHCEAAVTSASKRLVRMRDIPYCSSAIHAPA